MELAVKQRVLGGIILVASAVLFLPVLLDGAGVVSLQAPQIPAEPSLPSDQMLAPVLDEKAKALEAAIDSERAEPTFFPIQPQDTPTRESVTEERFHIVEAAPSEPVEKPQELRTTDVAEPAAAPASVKPPVVAPEKIQQALAATLAEKKQAPAHTVVKTEPVKVQAVKTESKTYQRPQVAELPVNKPTPTLTATSKLEPAAKAESEAAAKAPAAWVVQVASLSSKESADALVAKLRAKGLRAAVGKAGENFKVSVGPELDRDLAEALKARINSDASLGLTGFITPYRP